MNLTLEASYLLEEPTAPEEERFEKPTRQIWFHLRSYLVKKDDSESLFNWLKEQNLWGRRMPESRDLYKVFLGEFYWSPAFKYHANSYYGDPGWTRGWNQKLPAEVLVSTDKYFGEASTRDCSVRDTIHISLPVKSLVDGMHLQWNGREGCMYDATGRLIAFDPSVWENGARAVLICRDAIQNFLEENNYALLWTILGEKSLIGGRTMNPEEWKGRLKIDGAFRLRRGKVEGALKATFEGPKRSSGDLSS